MRHVDSRSIEGRVRLSHKRHLGSGLPLRTQYVIGGKNDLLHDMDANALVAWVDKYCQEHPLDTIVKAATELALELDRRSKPGGLSHEQN
jgi:hypothetical protein